MNMPMEGRESDPDSTFASAEVVSQSPERGALSFPMVVTSKDPGHGEEVRLRAQTLSTNKYLEMNWVSPAELNEKGLFIDEYAERSVYLFAENSVRDSTCRYIQATKEEGIMSLPTAKYFALDVDEIRKAAGIESISKLKAREVIEVSALASIHREGEATGRRSELDATRLLYARILRDSLDQGHKLWLLNTSEGLLRSLELFLGKDQIHRLGDPVDYRNSMVVPAAINPQEVVRSSLADETQLGDVKRQYLKEILKGVSDKHLSPELITLLDKHNIPYERTKGWERLVRQRKKFGAAALAGLGAWSVVKAAPIFTVDGPTGVAFGVIDLATIPPYLWGISESVAGKTPTRRFLASSVLAGSIVAPYAYLWGVGEEYPWWVNGFAGSILGVAALSAGRALHKDIKISRALRTAILVPEPKTPEAF